MPEQFTDYFRQCLHHLFTAARTVSLLSLLSLIALSIAVPLLTSCGEKSADKPAPPRPVRYVVVAPSAFGQAAIRTGEIRAHDETTLAFRLDGRMVSRLVDIGDRVRAGQVLARLESTTGQNQLTSAKADLEAAKASEQVAALNLSRMQKLMPSGAIARTQLDSARADWLTAASRLKSSQAALRNAEDNLAWTQLTSPADGVITGVSAAAGQVVSAGQTVFTLATSDRRDVVIDITDPQRLSADTATHFPVALLADPAVQTTGIVRDISPQADPQTRTWRVRLTLLTPPAAMALGASVTVAMPADPGSDHNGDTYAVPATAIARLDNRPAVFLIDNHQQVQLRPVTLAGYTASLAIIASGVAPGDKVVTAGVSKLRTGEKVIPGEQL